MNKSDYDKYYKKGGSYVIPVELFNELFDEIERLSFNYKQALEDLDKKDDIKNELENYIRARADDNNTCSVCSVMSDDLLNILKGSDKE